MTNSTDNLKAKETKSIEEEKQEHKFMFQFVDHETGKRSEPFVGNWDTVKETLSHVPDGERPTPEDFILLVAVLDGEKTQIPATPLITVKTLLQFMSDKHELSEKLA